MSNRGFGSAFTIRRKVNQFALVFATYLDGLNSLAQSWIDRADVPLTVQNGATTGSDADDGLLMPFGYRGAGAACLNANIGLTSAGVKTFTVSTVFSRDALSNNDAIFAGIFGNSYFPRLYFTAGALTVEFVIDGVTKTITVASPGLAAGQPVLVTIVGDVTTGTIVYVNGVSAGINSTTGTKYDTNTGAFTLMKDAGKSYNLTGYMRYFFAVWTAFTPAQITTLMNMLTYEGYFDVWRDFFTKWTQSPTTLTGTAAAVQNSPYSGTTTGSPTANASFDVQDERTIRSVKISAATGASTVFVSHALGNGVKTITGAKALTLPGVTAGTTITLYCEAFVDVLGGTRAAALEIDFYTDAGAAVGSTISIPVATAAAWQQIKKLVVVPATATRVNVTQKVSCGNGENLQLSISGYKIA